MNSYPELYLIGAMKSGTTTLYSHLKNHKNIFLCPKKEPGYFSRDERYAKGEQWYLDLFAHAQDGQIKVDASTCYSRWPHFDNTIERIASVSPNAKFIYIMRDPVDRTYSHYRHRMTESILSGKSIISFVEAIKTDKEMMCASDYALQISKYLEYFSIEQFYFTTLDLLVHQPQKVMTEIYDFLDLENSDQNGSFRSIQANKAEDKIIYRKNLEMIKKLKNSTYIQNIKFLIPSDLRAKIRFSAFSVLNAYRKPDVTEFELKEISILSEKNTDYLRAYFNESISNTEVITGLNLSSWKNK